MSSYFENMFNGFFNSKQDKENTLKKCENNTGTNYEEYCREYNFPSNYSKICQIMDDIDVDTYNKIKDESIRDDLVDQACIFLNKFNNLNFQKYEIYVRDQEASLSIIFKDYLYYLPSEDDPKIDRNYVIFTYLINVIKNDKSRINDINAKVYYGDLNTMAGHFYNFNSSDPVTEYCYLLHGWIIINSHDDKKISNPDELLISSKDLLKISKLKFDEK